MNFDSSTCRSRDMQLLVTENLPVFVTVFVFKKWFKTGINKLSAKVGLFIHISYNGSNPSLPSVQASESVRDTLHISL